MRSCCIWARGRASFPTDAYERALAYQWLFFEQYSHEPYIAVRRALLTFPNRKKDATPERLALTLERGNKALRVMEKRLGETPFFAGQALSVADIALYAYTHDGRRGRLRPRSLIRPSAPGCVASRAIPAMCR